MKDRKQSLVSDLLAYDQWRESIPISPVTGWRWRKLGWIETVNIAGRVYVSRAAILKFEQRAAAGEFSRDHKTPKRPQLTDRTNFAGANTMGGHSK